MTRDDREAVRDLHTRLGEDGYRSRFFGSGPRLAEDYVRHLATSDGTIALLAERDGGAVALGTAEPLGPDTAEVAFVVALPARGLGLGSLLLEHLAAAARRRGITRFTADVLSTNTEMLAVLADAGFAETSRNERGTVVLSLDIDLVLEALAAADAKERTAQAESLRPLLRPRSVAVAGVRSDGTGVGAAILRSIVAGSFDGAATVIDPSRTTIAGVPVWRTFADAPDPVDLAVVAVPAAAVLGVLTDAAAAGIRAAVVVSSGFEELGPDGRHLQREILDLARRASMRIVGPNCLGLLSQGPDVHLDATFGDEVPRGGGIAVASQSGGVGITLLDVAHDLDLGLRYFVSLGDKVDVSSNDLLAAWTDEEDVSAALLYLESFGNPLKFARVARTFARRKPLLAVVGGRSTSGARGGASHTAAATTPAAYVGALFAAAGVIPCSSAEEMAGAALVLTGQPRPVGRRLGILTNAGGTGVLAADTAEQLGLHVPPLSRELGRRLASVCPALAGAGNPVDAGAAATPEHLEALAAALVTSGEVDALLAVVVPTRISDGAAAVTRLLRLAGQSTPRPLIVVAMGSLWQSPRASGSVAYPSVEMALRSIAHAAAYAAWREAPEEITPPVERDRMHRGAELVRTFSPLGADGSGRWLSAGEVGELLAPYGLAPVGKVVTGADDAVRAAEEVGWPVAVKAANAQVVHKTERGLVRLRLTDAAQVRTAVAQIDELLARDDSSVLVQPMSEGTEIALGLVRDDRFGPLVMVAAGGVHTDVWADRTFLLPPITRAAAERALRALRIFPLLAGHRDTPPADVDALTDLIVALGLLGTEVPEVAELDVNPVHVDASGCRVVDVKLQLAPARAVDAGVPRRLRDRP
ncbi:GNAT family N-acetyltransferase [Nocardioides nematodiphilus]|uniref:GNAT family N-acetyltransferase n=1 Tax=Nocardioides nematodiphilus TaxID=2849669 RepID=UPI001CD91A04|nr:GNAT family N-acetyltransferase [Nocardioides nematodiphilus]MCA1981869.1 GNAT family N-acetyltransferase [Nocardioides nematodiphilus]